MAESRLIQDRYRLIDLIGRGGMGEVWSARDESLGRRVAVKCLKPLTPQQDETFTRVMRERFRREARVAASLQHRGITVVHDFGEHEGVLYLVMELLQGRTLSQLLESGEDGAGSPLPVAEIEEIADQVATALAYTHDQGVVHRDLKPANIMRLTDGTLKICDFGIARLGHDIGFTQRITGTGIAMGTPHYMSPEQIGGGHVDHRSDLYSLGCVLYELATGVPPFDLEDAWAVLVGHRDTMPRPPRGLRPDLPDYLDRIILDLLEKDPGTRPEDAGDLAVRIHAGRGPVAPAAGVRRPRGPAGRSASRDRSTGHGAPGAVRTAHPSGSEPGLPSWTEGMTTGPKASGALDLHITPPDAAAGLSGPWKTTPPGAAADLTGSRTGGPAVQAPGEDGAGSPARPAAPGPGSATEGARPTPPGSRPAAAQPEAHSARHPAPARTTGPAAVLASRHEAGLNLGRQGRWTQAVEVHRAVAAERAQVLGPDHPDTLASRYEVAFTLSRTGRPEIALGEYGDVAAARARVLGADHPDTLAALQETAFELGQLGRHAEAHQVYSTVLLARTRAMGRDHPDTLRCRHNLAFNLSRLGRLEESCRMASEVAAARARVLGAHHPDTLVTQYEVAYVLGLLGRWDQALELYRAIADARTRVLGPDHPDTFAARYEIGISLGRLGRGAEALELYQGLVADRGRVDGPEAPETLRARHGLGVNLGRLRRWEEALAEARDVAAVRARVLGPDHPDTLVSRREVAVALGWLGRWPDALPEYRAVAAARARSLGADHPDTLAAHNDEAHCLEQLGRGPEAAAVYRRVAALRQRQTP